MSGAMRFRNGPVEVEAMQFDGSEDNAKRLLAWAEPLTHGRVLAARHKRTHSWIVVVETLELPGAIAVDPGDWLIYGWVGGKFWVCPPDIFAATYEPAAPVVPEEPQR